MLPSNLLLARRRSGKIEPVWLTPTDTTLAVVSDIQQIFVNAVGRKKTDLDEALHEFEEASESDYRQVRGIATILERRCVYALDAAIDPQLARRTVFHETANTVIPITQEERHATLSRVASQLGVTVEQLENSLYADLKEESKIESFEPLDIHQLIRQYNLEITQTLLFNCTELSFHGSLNWKIIFGLIKWLGLMYDIEEQEEGYLVTVEGPLNLIKASRRYGTRLAMLLPHIVSAEKWTIHATIADWRDPRNRQEFEFAIYSKKHGPLLQVSDIDTVETYDSSVEERFAQDFRMAKTGWTMSREPRPLKAGTHVMIPDFLFERFGKRIYMEIAGFWTTEYISKKINKLQNLQEVDMIVAADEALACEEMDSLPENIHVFYYRRKVPIGPIVHYLRSKEAELTQAHLQQLELDNVQIEPNAPVISVSELASQMAITESSLRTFLQQRPVTGYRIIGDDLVSDTVLREIDRALHDRLQDGPLMLSEAVSIINAWNIEHPTSVLEHLGYTVDWTSLDSDDQQVYRNNVV
ncbi:MAG: DUF790 family protein [Candidatus Thorarchaeota archaeon]|nr:DUF790 family protein [Candidatus Thorarchaeota archaeon]